MAPPFRLAPYGTPVSQPNIPMFAISISNNIPDHDVLFPAQRVLKHQGYNNNTHLDVIRVNEALDEYRRDEHAEHGPHCVPPNRPPCAFLLRRRG